MDVERLMIIQTTHKSRHASRLSVEPALRALHADQADAHPLHYAVHDSVWRWKHSFSEISLFLSFRCILYYHLLLSRSFSVSLCVGK